MAESGPIRVMVIARTAAERLALAVMIKSQPAMELVAEKESCRSGLAWLEGNDSDVILLDQALLNTESAGFFRDHCTSRGECRILLLALHELDAVRRLARFDFINDYVLKGNDASRIIDAIQALAQNGRGGNTGAG
jgi:DNA-binding NarL/FixJ family response regulator